jgi:hypothetical protein
MCCMQGTSKKGAIVGFRPLPMWMGVAECRSGSREAYRVPRADTKVCLIVDVASRGAAAFREVRPQRTALVGVLSSDTLKTFSSCSHQSQRQRLPVTLSSGVLMSSTNCRTQRQITLILYNIPHCQIPMDNNGKSNQRASTASCGAARSAVARREVRPSDFSDRVAKWFRNIPERKPTNPNYFGSFTTENGAGAKGEMGKGWEGIATSSRGSENNWLGTCEARHVSVGP